ncbi:MAG: ribonuclease III [Glaciecola sp.]
MINPYIKLLKHIGYEFTDVGLLKQALTHRSANKTHNERLEFLGDAVLGLVIAQRMYEKFPDLPEGKLTRMRSNLVKGDTLAKVARELDLGELIKLGPGEMKSGGHRRDSILADVVEAIIGAVYLDAGLEAATNIIDVLFAKRIENLNPNVQIKDNKTQLQEYLQSRQIDLPDYQVVEISGKDHAQTFTVECTVAALDAQQSGSGRSRRIAEQEAAKLVLENINK